MLVIEPALEAHRRPVRRNVSSMAIAALTSHGTTSPWYRRQPRRVFLRGGECTRPSRRQADRRHADLCHRKLFVVGLRRRQAAQHYMNARVKHQVRLKHRDTHTQRSIVTQRCHPRRDDLRKQAVQLDSPSYGVKCCTRPRGPSSL